MAQDGKKLKPPVIGAFRWGTMTGAEFAPSTKFAHPDVKLVGDWEGEGLGYWYANWKAVVALAHAGLLQQLPGDGKKFQAVTGYRFCVWRVQGEGDAHDWFAIAYDAQGQQLTLAAFTDPVEPQDGAQAAPPPGQPGGPVTAPQAPPQDLPVPAGHANPQPPTNHSTAEQRAEDKAKRERQTLAQVDALYGTCLAVAAFHQVRVFDRPATELDPSALQAGAASVMIRLEHLGYDPPKDRSRAYLLRLQRLEHLVFPDRCSDPDANRHKEKPAEQEKPKRRSRAGPPKEKPKPAESEGKRAEAISDAIEEAEGVKRPKEEEPESVSTIPGAESMAGKTADGLDLEDDELPF